MDSEPNVYKCDRCVLTFDVRKIVQGVYGTRHCNKCIKQLRKHELENRRAQWIRPLFMEEAPSISIRCLDQVSNQV